MVHITIVAQCVPIYAHVLAICRRGPSEVRFIQRRMAGPAPHPSLPPLGRERLRPRSVKSNLHWNWHRRAAICVWHVNYYQLPVGMQADRSNWDVAVNQQFAIMKANEAVNKGGSFNNYPFYLSGYRLMRRRVRWVER